MFRTKSILSVFLLCFMLLFSACAGQAVQEETAPATEYLPEQTLIPTEATVIPAETIPPFL